MKLGESVIDRNIFLVGQDKVGEARFSTLFSLSELADFQFIQINSINIAKNTLIEERPSLIIINIANIGKIEKLLNYLGKNYADIPVILISNADRELSQSLITKGVQYVIPPDHVDQVSLMQCILSAFQHKCIENNLHLRDEILQAVNYAAEVFLSQVGLGSRIDEVLERLGKTTQAERTAIYKNEVQEDQELTAVLQAEWVDGHVHPLSKELDVSKGPYLESGYSRWLEMFRDGEMVCEKVQDLPQAEQPRMQKMGVQAILAIPIFTDRVLWGFIRFDHCAFEKKWSSAELDALFTSTKIIGAAVARQDSETRLTHLATHDYLTNLPNRMLLEDRFTQAVSRAERSGKKFGIVAIDLDKFKHVNDAHGHPFGDKVLVEVAWRLSEAVRSSDTCARVGGDEFTVLAEGIRNKKDLMRVMEKLANSLKEKITITGKMVQISASMGASIYPNHGTELEQLMKAADIALYQIKDTYSGYKIFIDDQYPLIKS